MIKWYDEVSERLSAEAQAAQDANGERRDPRRPGLAAEDESTDSEDERSQAAKYFSNPFYRDGDGRPRIVRRSSKQRPYSREALYERGRGLVYGVRHFISPAYDRPDERRRRSYPERRDQIGMVDGPPDEDPAPTTLHPGYVPRRERQAAAAAAAHRRQQDTPSTELDSSEESPGSSRPPSNNPPPPGTRPPLNPRRSSDAPTSPGGYFPSQSPHQGRRHSAHSPLSPGGPGSGFGPSESPLFASQVNQLQQHSRRPGASPLREPWDPKDVKGPRDQRRDSRDHRDDRRDSRDPRDRDRDHPPRARFERDGRPEQRPPAARRSSSEQKHSYGGGRHYGGEGDFPDAYRAQSERERDRDRERQRDRERERERERDRRRSRSQGYGSKERERGGDGLKRGDSSRAGERPRLARHVTPVDGVGGRKYVSPVWGNRWDRPGPEQERVRDV